MEEHDVVWVTKDGQRLRREDFTDSHLLNTIRFCRRRLAEFEDDDSHLIEPTDSDHWLGGGFYNTLHMLSVTGYTEHWLKELTEEARSRGLTVE